MVVAALRMHPDVFDPKLITEENVQRVEAWVDTRVFGSHNTITCALIPFADALNHSDVWINMNTVNKSVHHLGKQAPGSYCHNAKYLIDFSVMHDELSKFSEEEQLNLKGRFSQANYEANKIKFESCEGFTKFRDENKDKGIWDMPWMVQNFRDEDSDSASEDEDESDEEETKDITEERFKDKL